MYSLTSRRQRLLAVVLTAIATSMVAATSSLAAPGKNSQIAFARYFDAVQSWGAVFTIDPHGKDTTQITTPAKGTLDVQPKWAPDGSLIAFTRCAHGALCHVFVVAPNGAGLAPVGAECPAGANEQTCPTDADPSFSPDSKLLALVQETGAIKQDSNGDNWIEHSALVLVNRDGSGRRVIYQAIAFGGDLENPVFSPDGTQLAFERVNSGFSKPAGARALFVMSAEGSNARRLTPWAQDDGDDPDWSPNGKWILFRSFVDNTSRQSQIFLMHRDGTGRKQLTHFSNGTYVSSSTFSPDGESIVLSKGPVRGNIDLYTMRLDGTHLQRVTRSKLWDAAPDWGPR